MKKYWINSTLASLCLLMAGGCWRVKTPPAWQYEVRPEVFAQGPPKPADAAVASSDVATTRTAVKIDPAAASGYENVPDQLKQLYGPNPLPLIQESVIEQTLAHNRDIKIQNFYLQTAELGLPLSKGIYDLLLEAKALANKDQTATASALSAAGERRRREYDLSVTQLTPSGARAQAGYMFTKVSQVFQFTTLNPAITQGLVFSLTQPLLRGFGPKATNVGIHIAQVNGRISAAQLEATIQDQIRSALDLYWNLLFEVQNYDVQVISYTAALDLLRINKAKVEAGILPPTEALQAQARAETRREAIITARQRVRDAEDRLKKLMFFQDNAPNWDLELKPEQELTWREVQIDPEGALAEALDERPEIRASLANLDLNDQQIIAARDKLKPRLDATASALFTGIGNSTHDSEHMLNDWESNKFEGFLSLSAPFQNRQARYELAQRKTDRQRAMEEFERTRDTVAFDVRQAIRGVKTARERIDITRARVESEQANLDAEKKRYEVGVSTSFQVLEFQEFLANAQQAHLLAIVDYNRALVALERARGTILKTYGITIASPDLNPPGKQSVILPVGLN